MKCINCMYEKNCSLKELVKDITGCDGHSKSKQYNDGIIPLNKDEERKAIMKIIVYLDKINLLPYLERFKGKTVRNMMDKLEKDYPYKDKYSKSLFNVFNENNFVYYLNTTYKLNLEETTVTGYFI